MLWRVLLLIFGVFATATAVIMIKACDVAPTPLAGYRLLVAAVVLSPLFVRDWRRYHERYGLPDVRRTLLPALVLAGHFISWTIAARLTQTANASLIVNMVPIVMPFILYLLIRERLNRGEVRGTVLAMCGILLLGLFDFHLVPENVAGDAGCFGSMILFAFYLGLGRRNRDFPTVWLYTVPLYFFAGVACIVAGAAAGSNFAIDTQRDLLLTIGLGVVPTVIGHSVLNYSMRHLRGQAVSIVNLGQFIFAGTMGYFLLDDLPKWAFFVAAPLAVAGAVLALRATPEAPAGERSGEKPR